MSSKLDGQIVELKRRIEELKNKNKQLKSVKDVRKSFTKEDNNSTPLKKIDQNIFKSLEIRKSLKAKSILDF